LLLAFEKECRYQVNDHTRAFARGGVEYEIVVFTPVDILTLVDVGKVSQVFKQVIEIFASTHALVVDMEVLAFLTVGIIVIQYKAQCGNSTSGGYLQHLFRHKAASIVEFCAPEQNYQGRQNTS